MFFMAVAIVALVISGVLFWLWRRSRRPFVLVAAILWLAYALWEFGVQIFTPEAYIRVDLLFFYPILLIALALGLWFGLRSRKPGAKPGT